MLVMGHVKNSLFTIFMVVPFINNIKHFIFPNNALKYKFYVH